jgi:hypothetical protein
MVRLVSSLLASSALLLACAGSPPTEPKPLPLPTEPQFANDEARSSACTALRDHAIILFADEWADREGVSVGSPEERAALYDGWFDQLNKRGSLARFQAACAQTLTPNKYKCGMRSRTPDRLVDCLKVGSVTVSTQGQPIRAQQ